MAELSRVRPDEPSRGDSAARGLSAPSELDHVAVASRVPKVARSGVERDVPEGAGVDAAERPLWDATGFRPLGKAITLHRAVREGGDEMAAHLVDEDVPALAHVGL